MLEGLFGNVKIRAVDVVFLGLMCGGYIFSAVCVCVSVFLCERTFPG